MSGEYHVIVKFGPGFTADDQGAALLAFERLLRTTTGMPAEVFKTVMEDDSKLRRSMTVLERSKL